MINWRLVILKSSSRCGISREFHSVIHGYSAPKSTWNLRHIIDNGNTWYILDDANLKISVMSLIDAVFMRETAWLDRNQISPIVLQNLLHKMKIRCVHVALECPYS